MEGGVCEVKFFQVFTMIVMVLATVGVIGESGRGKHVYMNEVFTPVYECQYITKE